MGNGLLHAKTAINTASMDPVLTQPWQQLLESSFCGIAGSDATNSPTWAAALADTIIRDTNIAMLHIGDSHNPTGLLPYFRDSKTAFSLYARKLKAVTEAHAGRSSLIVKNNSHALCHTLLDALGTKIPDWDMFQLTTVSNSMTHQAILEKTNNRELMARCIGTIESPYIELGKNWTETFDALPKKLRWTIRKSEKDLQALGQLTYEECSTPEVIGSLFSAIYEIEQLSWKEKSGTSITTQKQQKEFYESLAKHASTSGILSAHVLRLDGKPLAYILGLISGDGSFLDLKESFVESHSQYSPAHVLKRFAFPALIAKGVSIYDFMGVCEPYKMRWTDKTYKRHTLVLYNKTVRGRMAYLKARLTKSSTPVPAPSNVKPVLQETDS